MILKSSSLFPEFVVIDPEVHQDERGFFTEIYHQEKFGAAGIRTRFVVAIFGKFYMNCY
jgi:dTDP-4-dehydrorhamnose 3,5-epimerase-like enzyme